MRNETDEGAREALVEQMAEALELWWRAGGDSERWTGAARAVLPVVAAQVEAAVSVVRADLGEQLRDARVRLDERTRMCDAADEAAERRLDQSIKWMERAESAESDLRALREGLGVLADDPTPCACGDNEASVRVGDLRALLAPSPAEGTGEVDPMRCYDCGTPEADCPGIGVTCCKTCAHTSAPVSSGEAGEAWVDRHGDMWTFDEDGIGSSPECANFSRKYVEKKWGPLRPAPVVTHSAEDGAPC